jgi:hypothetical protein
MLRCGRLCPSGQKSAEIFPLPKFLAVLKTEDGEAQAIFGRRCIATIQIALSRDGGTLQKIGEDSWKVLIQSWIEPLAG